MRHLVGVDLRPHSRGALHMCRWMADHAHAADGDRFEALHVLQDRDIRPLLSHVSLSEVERMARESFDQTLTESELRPKLAAADLVFDAAADRALARRADDDADTMLVIGRRALGAGRGWIRLGRVARRLLRSLPAAVTVVPPDFVPSDTSGPVILATSLESDTEGAADMALRLARRWTRPLLAVHILPEDLVPAGYLPRPAQQTLAAAHRRDAELRLALWLRRHDMPDVESVVRIGDVVEQLTTLALERSASALVVGSRRLSLQERLFRSSVGSDLAGSAAVPVVVAPPPAT